MAVTDAAIKALDQHPRRVPVPDRRGEYRWFSDVIRVIRKADGSGHAFDGRRDDRHHRPEGIEETLAYRATHDTLTGLLNREQLDIELARVHQLTEPWALLFLDLNGFKDVNDGLGHSIGDEVLRIVARRLQRRLDPTTSSPGSAGTSSACSRRWSNRTGR